METTIGSNKGDENSSEYQTFLNETTSLPSTLNKTDEKPSEP